MQARLLDKDLYYLGGNDRRLDQFENMFTLPGGVSYNSYLLLDEKTVLFDAVDAAIADAFLDELSDTLGGRELDVLVCHHVEPDHAASVKAVLEAYPKAKLMVSAMGLRFLGQFYRDFDFSSRAQVVKEGDVLETGHHRLHFIAAPNVHWPEVLVSFDETTGSLFSADAFGSFGAIAGYLFADQLDFERDWLDEARRYYGNIVGRQGLNVMKLLDKAADLPIKRILPLHGPLYRTPETIELILEKYRCWASYKAEEPGVVIVYGSMYQHTAQLSDRLAGLLADENAGPIRVYDVSKTNISFIIADLFRFSHAVFCCNNYNTELYPKMDALLRELMMLNWDKHKFSIVGNGSWGGRGCAIAEEILSRAKALEKVGETFAVKSSFDTSQEEELRTLAAAIADSLKKER